MDQESMEMFGKVLDKLDSIDGRLDKMENRLDKVENRLDKVENRLDVIEVRQNKMSSQLTELQLSQKLFEMNTNRNLAKLQDSVDTIEEILKMNDLLPR